MGISSLRRLAASLFDPEATASQDYTGVFWLEVPEYDPINLGNLSGRAEELLHRLADLGIGAAEERVIVRRHPAPEGEDWGNATVELRFFDVHSPHLRLVSGGRGVSHDEPLLYVRMSCADIPEDHRLEFGHSCTHGSGPHEIIVYVEEASDRIWTWMQREAGKKPVHPGRPSLDPDLEL